MVAKESWNIIADSPTDISIQPSTLTVACSPAKPSVAITPAACCLRAVSAAQRVPRRRSHRLWRAPGMGHNSSALDACAAAQRNAFRSLTRALEPKGSANSSCRGRAAKPDVRSRPADLAQRWWRLQRGKAFSRAGGTGGRRRLPGAACQERELLSRQLPEGGKQSWEKNLPVNCQAVSHFSEAKRL